MPDAWYAGLHSRFLLRAEFQFVCSHSDPGLKASAGGVLVAQVAEKGSIFWPSCCAGIDVKTLAGWAVPSRCVPRWKICLPVSVSAIVHIVHMISSSHGTVHGLWKNDKIDCVIEYPLLPCSCGAAERRGRLVSVLMLVGAKEGVQFMPVQ